MLPLPTFLHYFFLPPFKLLFFLMRVWRLLMTVSCSMSIILGTYRSFRCALLTFLYSLSPSLNYGCIFTFDDSQLTYFFFYLISQILFCNLIPHSTTLTYFTMVQKTFILHNNSKSSSIYWFSSYIYTPYIYYIRSDTHQNWTVRII